MSYDEALMLALRNKCFVYFRPMLSDIVEGIRPGGVWWKVMVEHQSSEGKYRQWSSEGYDESQALIEAVAEMEKALGRYTGTRKVKRRTSSTQPLHPRRTKTTKTSSHAAKPSTTRSVRKHRLT